MSKKLICVDCDDTLIYHGEKTSFIPESARQAIRELQQNGHQIALSSGRSVFQVEQLMVELGIAHSVCFNGHMVLSDKTIIHDDPISEQELMPIIEHLVIANKSIFAVDTDNMYINDPNGKITYFIKNKMRPGHLNSEDSFEKNIRLIDAIKRKYYFFMVFDYDLDNKLSNFSRQQIELKHWNDYVYEVLNRQTSKLSGIKLLCKHLNTDSENVYAFGDSYNDIEMVSGAAHGIAMGNSPDALKQVADYVTNNVNKDGFYNACKHYRLI